MFVVYDRTALKRLQLTFVPRALSTVDEYCRDLVGDQPEPGDKRNFGASDDAQYVLGRTHASDTDA